MDAIFNFLLLLVLQFFSTSSSHSYIRTEGVPIQLEGGARYPERREVFSCLGICDRTPTCVCARISSSGDGTCNNFNNSVDPNALNPTGFVYFAWAVYKDTLEKENIALQKPAHQSSVYFLNNVRYTADRAVDGNRNVDGFQAPYFSHTQDGEKADTYPWWQVDLEEEHIVTGVNILNRRQWSDRLHDFEIRVGNNRMSSTYSHSRFDGNPLCAKRDGAGVGDAKVVHMTCRPCPLRGRYLGIQIVRYCQKCDENRVNVLQLAEVDVFGKKVDEEKEKTSEKLPGGGSSEK